MINKKIAVIGGGSWGTALAVHLSNKIKEINIKNKFLVLKL